MNIAIISAGVRVGRKSHRVALFLQKYIEANQLGSVDLIDLNEYKFPIFDERLSKMENPSVSAVEFSERVKKADGVIIVTPEYNGGYPASLKNAVDLLYAEWTRKPVALATASDGQFGGSQVTTSFIFSMWKIGAWMVPAKYPGPKVQEIYDQQGIPFDKVSTEKRVKPFIDELLWCMEAGRRMKVGDVGPQIY